MVKISFNKTIEVDGCKIGHNHPCYIIAEAGVNHFRDMKTAFALIDAAVNAGASAFKTQHFNTEALVSASAQNWRERLKSKELEDDNILRMRDYCAKRKITFLCTAHDELVLNFLVREEMPAYKIGSGEVENWPFISKIAGLAKPVILSVGMYSEKQVHEVISLFKLAQNPDLAILHCHTGYPSKPEDINLSVMEKIRTFFSGPVGYSDHTIGSSVCLAAVALGADIIEKHITIDRNIPNAQDWIVSCDPIELKSFVKNIREVENCLGNGIKSVTEQEKMSLAWARKSLVAAIDISAGMVISSEMIDIKRPGAGISPSKIDKIIGRTAIKNISKDYLILEEDLK